MSATESFFAGSSAVFCVVHDDRVCNFTAANAWRQCNALAYSDGDSHSDARRYAYTDASGSNEPTLRLQPEREFDRSL